MQQNNSHCTKMKFSIKDFFSKCDQIRSFLKTFLMENFIVCAVLVLCLSPDKIFETK